jgi:tryptophan synthase beta chain
VSHLVAAGLVEGVAYPQRACFDAAVLFAGAEGILPAREAVEASMAKLPKVG